MNREYRSESIFNHLNLQQSIFLSLMENQVIGSYLMDRLVVNPSRHVHLRKLY